MARRVTRVQLKSAQELVLCTRPVEIVKVRVRQVYGRFEIDLGDPGRFKTYGELVAEIYGTIWNSTMRASIRCCICRPPCLRPEPAQLEKRHLKNTEPVSKETYPLQVVKVARGRTGAIGMLENT